MSKIFLANWKMNKTVSEAKTFMKEFLPAIKNNKNEIYVATNFLALVGLQKEMKGSNVALACQNFYPKDAGAFTGEISLDMVEDIGVSCAMIGHSERRIYFGESDEFVNEKVLKALEKGFKIFFCIGETQEERENKQTLSVLTRQLKIGLANVSAEQMKNVYVAYEPIWSISTFSTGKTANIEEIFEVHKQIKCLLADMFPTNKDIKLLFGGSVNPQNCKEILALSNVDGALIGGACLKVESLLEIVE